MKRCELKWLADDIRRQADRIERGEDIYCSADRLAVIAGMLQDEAFRIEDASDEERGGLVGSVRVGEQEGEQDGVGIVRQPQGAAGLDQIGAPCHAVGSPGDQQLAVRRGGDGGGQPRAYKLMTGPSYFPPNAKTLAVREFVRKHPPVITVLHA